ncbi:MAG: class I SAM-dependent methyltransferase [Chloroflexi bacterium]|nr:class I SAM-dependent methyltransferase [Chloroflexota bacterium]
MGERVVEYAFVHSNILMETKQRILDVGSYGSVLPVELACFGHKVYSVDVLAYPLEHPNLTFVQGDIYNIPFPDNFFDTVTAVSTVEHVGLGRYGDPLHPDGDRRAILEMIRVLKKGGKAIITVPFGERTVSYHRGVAMNRVYDLPSLEQLLEGLQIQKRVIYGKQGGFWMPVTPEQAANLKREDATEEKSVALLVASKGQG